MEYANRAAPGDAPPIADATAADTLPAAPRAPTKAAHTASLAQAAHALKAPLAVIKGSATTLLAGEWDAPTRDELLALIDAQSDRLLRLLNNLLEVWRLEAGQTPLHREPVELVSLLDGLAERWATAHPSRVPQVRAPASLPATMLDAGWLVEALDRLVRFAASSAVDETPVVIEARAHTGDIELLLTAPGRSLAPEEYAALFEPFAAVANQDDTDELMLVRAVAAAHGGAVVAGPPAHGSGVLFRMTLPREDSALPAQGARSLGAQAPVAHSRRAQPVIVVAEHDERLAHTLRAHLEAQGYRVLLAGDTDQLKPLLAREAPDLVLLDALLGDGAHDAILASIARQTAVVVLGSGEEASCVRALDLGALDYLAQPFGMPELLARVRAAVRLAARPPREEPESTFRSGALTIEFAQQLVRIDACAVSLSRTEYMLLRVLAQHAGRVLTHAQLLERVWGPGYEHEVEFLWVYVRRLRRKIEPDPRHPCYILTVPGVGYRLAQL